MQTCKKKLKALILKDRPSDLHWHCVPVFLKEASEISSTLKRRLHMSASYFLQALNINFEIWGKNARKEKIRSKVKPKLNYVI